MAKRKRRAFTKEFKTEAVRVVQASGKTVGAVARELDLTETALREWVRQAEIDAGRGQPGALTTDERAELAQLRREVRTLRMERDILKKRPVRVSIDRGRPVFGVVPVDLDHNFRRRYPLGDDCHDRATAHHRRERCGPEIDLDKLARLDHLLQFLPLDTRYEQDLAT
jgi:transposase